MVLFAPPLIQKPHPTLSTKKWQNEKLIATHVFPRFGQIVCIKIILWKVRTIDFYSRVAMGQKNDRVSAANE